MKTRSNVRNVFGGLGMAVLALPSMSMAAGFVDNWLLFEGEAKPWSVNVGTRVWVNQQEAKSSSRSVAFALSDASIMNVTTANQATNLVSTNYEATPLPYLSARYGRFFISGSYYSKTDFTYQQGIYNSTTTYTVGGNINTIGNTQGRSDVSASREEWDISSGYYLIPNLAFTVGYKNADYHFAQKGQLAFNGINSKIQEATATNNFSGPTLGLTGSVPLSYGFGIYASYAHGFLSWDFKQSDGSNIKNVSADYDVAELGLTYSPNIKVISAHLPLEAATIFAGYRYQRYQWDWDYLNDAQGNRISESDFPPLKNMQNTNSGFVAGVNLAF